LSSQLHSPSTYYDILVQIVNEYKFCPQIPTSPFEFLSSQNVMFFLNKNHNFLNFEYQTIIPIQNLLDCVFQLFVTPFSSIFTNS
jgi:hypothetical protein